MVRVKNNLVIYTVITGDCDILREPAHRVKGWDYVCFTDNKKLKSKTWEIRYFNDEGLNKFKLSRLPKILPHEFLPQYEISLYLDSYIYVCGNIEPFINELLGMNKKMIVRQHPNRTTIYQEAAHLTGTKRFDLNFSKQVSKYRDEGFRGRKLYANGIMLRHHNDPEVIEVSKAWWNEILKYTHRDQLSLPYVCWKLNFDIGVFPAKLPNLYFMFLNKRPQIKIDKVIMFEGTPYGENLQYGRALNEFCERAPDDAWIIIRDRDTCYLIDNGKQITDVIRKFPDTGIFGCMTNRLGLEWQTVPGMFDETNIKKHRLTAEKLYKEHYDDVVQNGLPVAGLFMCFKKSTWEKVKFREGNMLGADGNLFDWDFAVKVKQLGMPVRIMAGVYLFHYYRMHKHIKNLNHITLKATKDKIL